jgi:Carboxypeptidase regulatory-like domain
MIASLIALVVSLGQAASPPAGTIRGHVFDRDTGQPLLRAVVRVTQDDRGDETVSITDERGAFTVAGLPPGRYRGVVVAREHELQTLRADAIVLGRDEAVDLVVRVPPTFGVDVRVVDPSGEPLSGLDIQVVSLDTGRTPFSSLQGTDDLGRKRVFGLTAGRYVICAGTLSAGMSLGAARGERLLSTCYPSNDESNAEPLRVDRANLEGIEIRMRRGRTFTISGTVLDAGGTPASAARADFIRYFPNGSSSSGAGVDASGRFRVLNVPPGAYAIRAVVLDVETPQEQRTSQAGVAEIQVNDADIDDLVIRLRKTVDVQGRIVSDDGVSPIPSSQGSGFTIDAVLAGARSAGWESSVHTNARADRTFTLPAVFGPRVLQFMNVPRGWYVKSVRYGERDVLDAPVEFAGGHDAPPLDVVVSNRGASINGTVTADDGTPARGATVYLLRQSPRGLYVAAAAPTTAAGVFTRGPLRGGEYVLVALPSTVELPPFVAQDRLMRLAALGEHVTLTDLDERSVPLRLVRER